MAKGKYVSPTLKLAITEEQWERAVRSSSGGCLVADAIKSQFPQFTAVKVDMATIAFTDREAGVRYVYLTPADAAELLLFYDQGWNQPIEEVTIRRAVKIVPIRRSAAVVEKQNKRQSEQLAILQAKLDRGDELNQVQQRAYTRLVKAKHVKRPANHGPAEVGGENNATVRGGKYPKQSNKDNPNLLRGRDRHYGAKLARPGNAFAEAVEHAVAERLASNTEG